MKQQGTSWNQMLKARARPLTALGAILATYAVALHPDHGLWQWSPANTAGLDALAKRFAFRVEPLPVLAANEEPAGIRRASDFYVRRVHPSLEHLCSWVSSVGASVAVGDLDGDGLPNDVCYVDTRTNQVIVAEVPGRGNSGARYEPFSLLAGLPRPSGRERPTEYDPPTMAPMGTVIGDFNEDGLSDILVYFWGRPPVIFLRCDGADPGAATPLGRERYLAQDVVNGSDRWFTNAAVQTDLDGDGHLDLVICNYFADDSRILDANDDVRNSQQMPASMSGAYNGGRKHLLVWKAAARGPAPAVHYEATCHFLDDPALEGKVQGGWTLAVGALDVDGDGLDELFFVNDFGPDHAFYNRSRPGQLRFTPLTGDSGDPRKMKSGVFGRDSNKGMGIGFGDLEGNGRTGFMVSNITTTFGLQESQFAFVRVDEAVEMRNGAAPFRNRAEELGLSRTGWGWDVKFGDFDNGGRQQIVQALGFVKGRSESWAKLHESATANDLLLHSPAAWHNYQPGDQLSATDPTAFFVWSGRGGFQNISRRLPALHRDLPSDDSGARVEGAPVSRGVAVADCEHDGRLDLFIANQWEPSYVFHNTAAQGAYVGLNLLWPLEPGEPFRAGDSRATAVTSGNGKRHPGRAAIGATATLYLPDGRVMRGQVDGGSGHSGRSSPELHFGLGNGIKEGTPLWTHLQWRDPGGHRQEEWVQVSAGLPREATTTPAASSGWQTIVLGWPRAGDREPGRTLAKASSGL